MGSSTNLYFDWDRKGYERPGMFDNICLVYSFLYVHVIRIQHVWYQYAIPKKNAIQQPAHRNPIL